MAETARADQYADTTEFLLYQHEETKSALFLSRDGHRDNARWIPRVHVIVPITTQLMKIDGEPSERGVFYLKSWKAKELGWVAEEDQRQLKLV